MMCSLFKFLTIHHTGICSACTGKDRRDGQQAIKSLFRITTLFLVGDGVQVPTLMFLEQLCSIMPAEAGEVGCFIMPLMLPQ